MDGSWSWGPHRDHRTPVLAPAAPARPFSPSTSPVNHSARPCCCLPSSYARTGTAWSLLRSTLYSVTPISNVCEVLILGYSYQPAAAASNARQPTATALPDGPSFRGPRRKATDQGPPPCLFFSRQTTRAGPRGVAARPHRRRRDPISPAIYAVRDTGRPIPCRPGLGRAPSGGARRQSSELLALPRCSHL